MRDPYHSARVRFKVARDRYLEDWFLQPAWLARIIFWRLCRRLTPLAVYEREIPESEWLNSDLVEAAGILHTMEKWKITDERQALMLWKLSRD